MKMIPSIYLSTALLFVACGQAKETSNSLDSASSSAFIGDNPSSNANIALGMPKDSKGRPQILISHKQYLLSWNPKTRTINWAAWEVDPNDLGTEPRADDFHTDTQLQAYLEKNMPQVHAVDPKEYQGSCFDRGHQVPSGDRTDNTADNDITFAMSNMAPQSAFFNRVTWESAEERERQIARTNRFSKVLIVAGPLYDSNPLKIGPNKDIPVPRAEFKVILPLTGNGSASSVTADLPIVAIVMDNITSKGKSAASDLKQACADQLDQNIKPGEDGPGAWKTSQTTLSDVEEQSGYSFFSDVPAAVRSALAKVKQ